MTCKAEAAGMWCMTRAKSQSRLPSSWKTQWRTIRNMAAPCIAVNYSNGIMNGQHQEMSVPRARERGREREGERGREREREREGEGEGEGEGERGEGAGESKDCILMHLDLIVFLGPTCGLLFATKKCRAKRICALALTSQSTQINWSAHINSMKQSGDRGLKDFRKYLSGCIQVMHYQNETARQRFYASIRYMLCTHWFSPTLR